MIVRYLLHGARVLALVHFSSLNCMKMTLATKLQCPNQATYQLVEAIKEDNVVRVQEAIASVDPTTLITVSEMYDMLEPKERSFKLSMLQLAVSFLARNSVALLLKHPVEVNFVDASVRGCVGHGTALMVLCRMLQPKDHEVGHQIIKMLLDKGASSHVSDVVGTPLTYRASAGDLAGVQLLLGAKADPHVVVCARRFGSNRIERHFLLRALVHDIEDRKEKNEDLEGALVRIAIVQNLLEAGALSYLHRLEVIGGVGFEEESALKIVKDPPLITLFKAYKKKTE